MKISLVFALLAVAPMPTLSQKLTAEVHLLYNWCTLTCFNDTSGPCQHANSGDDSCYEVGDDGTCDPGLVDCSDEPSCNPIDNEDGNRCTDYYSDRGYPGTSTDNYARYCQYGQESGWCANTQFATERCFDEC